MARRSADKVADVVPLRWPTAGQFFPSATDALPTSATRRVNVDVALARDWHYTSCKCSFRRWHALLPTLAGCWHDLREDQLPTVGRRLHYIGLRMGQYSFTAVNLLCDEAKHSHDAAWTTPQMHHVLEVDFTTAGTVKNSLTIHGGEVTDFCERANVLR